MPNRLKFLLAVLLLLGSHGIALATPNAATAWVVRAGTGDDTNGGGFDASLGGTSYANQDAAQATGTVSTSGTTATATASIFTSLMVGNIISDGTNRYTITAFTSGTVVTLNAAPSWTAVSIKVGGALASISKLASIEVAGNSAYIKGTTTLTTKITLATSGSNNAPLPWYGFTTAITDGGKATVTSSTNSTDLFECGGVNFRAFYNFNFTHTATTRGVGFNYNSGSSQGYVWKNCLFDGVKIAVYGDNGVPFTINNSEMIDCEVKNCTDRALRIGSFTVTDCYIHDSVSDNISMGAVSSGFIRCIRSVIVRSGRDNIRNDSESGSILIDGCVLRDPTSDNINTSGLAGGGIGIQNSIIAKGGGWGVHANSSSVTLYSRNNAYWSNVSGNLSNFSVGTNDVTLTGDPNTNAAGGDFSLNSAAGAGAACRAAGYPGASSFGSGYTDIGPLQHQDSGGGGGSSPRRPSVRTGGY